MTIIVAARTTHRIGRKKTDVQEAITIACDTKITDGWEVTSGAYPKIWHEEEQHLLLGAAGLVGAWQAVKHCVTWPHYADTQDWEAWLVKNVRPEIMHALACAGLLYQKKGMIDTNMCLIIATGTNLASIDAVGGVVVPRTNCVAIGSGYAEALGSLGDGPWTSDDVIKAALAPTKTNAFCGPPIYWATTLDYEIHEFVPEAS